MCFIRFAVFYQRFGFIMVVGRFQFGAVSKARCKVRTKQEAKKQMLLNPKDA